MLNPFFGGICYNFYSIMLGFPRSNHVLISAIANASLHMSECAQKSGLVSNFREHCPYWLADWRQWCWALFAIVSKSSLLNAWEQTEVS